MGKLGGKATATFDGVGDTAIVGLGVDVGVAVTGGVQDRPGAAPTFRVAAISGKNKVNAVKTRATKRARARAMPVIMGCRSGNSRMRIRMKVYSTIRSALDSVKAGRSGA